MSKRSKKALQRMAPILHQKRVKFAAKLVSDSPPIKHAPRPSPVQIVFGSFPPFRCCFPDKSDLGSEQVSAVSERDPETFDSIPLDRQKLATAKNKAAVQENLIFKSTGPVSCAHCLGLGHPTWECQSPVRCKNCFCYGHRAKSCFAVLRPKLSWKPKKAIKEGARFAANIAISSATDDGSSSPKKHRPPCNSTPESELTD